MNKYIYLIISLLFILYIVHTVKKKGLSVNESFFWILGSLLILILSIFPKFLDKISVKIGIAYPPSLLFLICITFLIFMNIRTNSQLNEQKKKLLDLTQNFAILKSSLELSDEKQKSNKKSH